MKKNLPAVVVLSGVFMTASEYAAAAVDAAVTTAISTGVTDAATIGGAILALVIGIAIFRHIRNAK